MITLIRKTAAHVAGRIAAHNRAEAELSGRALAVAAMRDDRRAAEQFSRNYTELSESAARWQARAERWGRPC